MVIADLGNLSALRTFRVLRALKTVAVIPGTTITHHKNTGVIVDMFANYFMDYFL